MELVESLVVGVAVGVSFTAPPDTGFSLDDASSDGNEVISEACVVEAGWVGVSGAF